MCSEAMVGPGLALEGRDMGDTKLAYGMKGVGKEIHGKAMHTVRRRRAERVGSGSGFQARWQLRLRPSWYGDPPEGQIRPS